MQHKVPLSLAAMTEPVNDTGDEDYGVVPYLLCRGKGLFLTKKMKGERGGKRQGGMVCMGRVVWFTRAMLTF